MDQSNDPNQTPNDPLYTPDAQDTAKQANRRLFPEATAPRERTPITVPPTTKVSSQDPLTSVQSELLATQLFVKDNVRDLHAQVSALSQQMSTLMTIIAANNTPPKAPATLGPALATLGGNSDSEAAFSNSESANATYKQAAISNSGSATHRMITASPPSNSGAAAVHTPSSIMLRTHLFKQTDQEMYEKCSDLKPKPINPSIALSAFRKFKPAAIQAIHAIKQPGISADIALSTFSSELRAVLNSPGDHTIGAILTEALTTGTKIAESTTQNLLRLAVKCGTPEAIYQQTEYITETGRYDRSLTSLTDVTQDPAYSAFDPETEQGKHLWTAILHLITAYWKRPKSTKADQAVLETTYKNLTCRCPTEVSNYITEESEIYTKLKAAHIVYSDQQRIRALLANCSSEIEATYQAYKKRKSEDNQWSHLNDTVISVFANDLETIAAAMDPAPPEPEQPRRTPRSQHKPEPAVDPDQPDKLREPTRDRPCWDHQFIADGCARGEHCPWEHVGEQGEKKLRHATEEGVCKAYLRDLCDRGSGCKFKHPPGKPDKPHKPTAGVCHGAPEAECEDFHQGTCPRGDDCDMLHIGAQSGSDSEDWDQTESSSESD